MTHAILLMCTVALCLTQGLGSLSATIMTPQSLEQLTAQADYVARVKVIQSAVRRDRGRHISVHQLKLLRLYDKAPHVPAPVSLVLETLGGSYQGLQQRVPGSPSLRRDEEVIVFLTCPRAEPQQDVAPSQHLAARCRLTGMGQGLWRLSGAQAGEELWSPSLEGLHFMRQGVATSSPLKPHPLSALLAQVGRARRGEAH